MAETTDIIDSARRKAGKAVLELLNTSGFEELTTEEIATEAEIEPDFLRRLFVDLPAVVDQGLRDKDDAVLSSLAGDFAEDPDASVREKILEGLIARYEAYTPFKQAIRHLNSASCQNPILGGMLIFRLNTSMHSLLQLAGGAGEGLSGVLRSKGLSAVALACQREWMKDDSPDLAATWQILFNWMVSTIG